MGKHLTLDERVTIKTMLDKKESFKSIGRALNKDCTTISKEVRNRIVFRKTGCFGNNFNDCVNRWNCTITKLCKDSDCKRKQCRKCPKCHYVCDDYQKELCPVHSKPPYVCNGCEKRHKCTLEKHEYSAVPAHNEYKEILSESRQGVVISEAESLALDRFISPLLRKGQSIHHICTSNPSEIMFSEKTIYNYVDYGMFEARNLDMPRKVRFRPRKSKHDSVKVDKACRVGRTYKDYIEYIKEFPDLSTVQIDSVIGEIGGKVLLTIHFVKAEFMLAFIRDRNTAASVETIFERLYWELFPDHFMRLFPVLLADNGSEFSDPKAIELDKEGNQRARMFYCDPSSPYQKGAAENNHSMIRRVLPKGASFNHLTQDDIDLMMHHINSYSRSNLGDFTPHEIFAHFYGKEMLEKLGAKLIPANEVTLLPALLK